MIFTKKALILFYTLSISISLIGQTNSNTVLFLKNYSPLDYNFGKSNWAIIQDNSGILYFGNEDGIIEFDGTNWRMLAQGIKAISFAKNNEGIIYVGCRNDIGFLAPNNIGTMEFHSLKANTDKNISNCWNIAIDKDNVLFSMSDGTIFSYNGENVTDKSFGKWGGYINKIKDKLFYETRVGLSLIDNDIIQPIKGAQQLASLNVRDIFEYAKDTTLIITRSNGFYIYTNNEIKKWDAPINDYIKKHQVYRATKINDFFYAFGTITAGVVIMNKKGELYSEINQNGGLQSNDHCAIYTDLHGNIWSGLEYGISNIFFSSPFSIYSKQSGLPNVNIYSMTIGNDKLFIGTSQGLFYKENCKNVKEKNCKFKLIPENSGRKIWDMFYKNEYLLSGSSNLGTFATKNKETRIIFPRAALFFLETDENNILASLEHDKGLAIFKYLNKKWHSKYLSNKYSPKQMVQDSTGDIIFIENNKIIQITLNKEKDSIIIENSFIIEDTSFIDNISIFKINDNVLYGTNKGTFQLKNNKLEPYKELNDKIGQQVNITEIKKDLLGKTWFFGTNKENRILGKIKSVNAKYETQYFQKALYKLSKNFIGSFLPINDSSILLGSGTKIINYNTTKNNSNNKKFHTLIRTVKTIGRNDSIIFGGNYMKKSKKVTKKENYKIPTLSFKDNALRFSYSAIFFEDIPKTKYKYRLIGYNDNWSNWTNKTEKDYSYLQHGQYKFEVKAKNIFNVESSISSFKFEILPPWYKTIFAYFLFSILFLLLIYIIVKLSIRKVEKEKQKLEILVKNRTAEIYQQKEEILAQNEEITSKSIEIERQRDLVLIQNKHIEKQNISIKGSIQYASRIQKALLPRNEKFKEYFSEYFVFFKPKDIVSGDFYWLKKIDEFILLSVADATGHGVPGALMSMLGIAYLNEIVTRRDIRNAGHVLDEMRAQIKTSLSQKGGFNDTNDGMDMSFITLDTKKNILQFAGANHSLYILRDNKLMKTKGDNQPAAYSINEKPFTNHEIKFQRGDSIYLLTDGFPDQFGGNNDKKFLLKNIENLFLHYHNRPMTEQQEILSKTLKKWISYGENEEENKQIDDILIVGIKL